MCRRASRDHCRVHGRMASQGGELGKRGQMLRTRALEVSLWEAVLPEEVLRLPEELARVDALLDDPVFFAPFTPFFDPRLGRPSTPMEVYLRLMFLKFRYRLGYETLCREVADSITWRRFCRIPIDARVPHPTTLMKLTTRCGTAAVDGCNEALLAKPRKRNCCVPPGCAPTPPSSRPMSPTRPTLGCWPKRCAGSPQPDGGSGPPAERPGPRCATAAAPPEHAPARSGRNCGCAQRNPVTSPRLSCAGSPASWPDWPNAPRRTRNSWCSMPVAPCAEPG